MPGLPEAEVIRRDLEKEIVGRRIKDIEVRPGSNAMKVIRRHARRKELQDLAAGAKVERVARSGRNVLLELDNGRVLGFDLGPQGQLLKTSASDGFATNTHVVIGFTIGGQLRFVDNSKEGEVYVTSREELAESLPAGAIDPLDEPLTWHEFSAKLEEREVPLKQLLMDDSFVVGLGEVYSDEVVFAAGLRFDRLSNKLSSQDVRRLYRALMEILQDAVRARGTTRDDDFTDLYGDPGQFQLELKVYERDGEACRRCRNQIVKEPYADGYTYFCPQCQS